MPDRLYAKRLKELMWRVPNLTPPQEEYAKAVFNQYAHFGSSGISRYEAEKVIKALRKNPSDDIHSHQIDAIEEEITKYFEG